MLMTLSYFGSKNGPVRAQVAAVSKSDTLKGNRDTVSRFLMNVSLFHALQGQPEPILKTKSYLERSENSNKNYLCIIRLLTSSFEAAQTKEIQRSSVS